VAVYAARFALGHLMLQQRFQQPLSRPAFAIGLRA
jgi:hypothetical protein